MDIACMSNRTEGATETNQPRKLYKPRREAGDLKPEVMVTYAADGCDPPMDLATPTGDSIDLSGGG